jgi:hypothetical protein
MVDILYTRLELQRLTISSIFEGRRKSHNQQKYSVIGWSIIYRMQQENFLSF